MTGIEPAATAGNTVGFNVIKISTLEMQVGTVGEGLSETFFSGSVTIRVISVANYIASVEITAAAA